MTKPSKQKKMNDNPAEIDFLLTDNCLWEQNRQNGRFHPHAIEVVDTKTGQTRYIKSGSRIRFISGNITAGRDQETYNANFPLTPTKPPRSKKK